MSAPKPLRILHVILNLERAGAQEVVRTLAEYQRAQGCQVLVCALRDGPLRSDIEKVGARVVIIPRMSSTPWPLRSLRYPAHLCRELAKIVRKYDIVILQTHLLKALDFAALNVCRHTNLGAVFWMIHNVDFLPIASCPWLTILKQQFQRWRYRLNAYRVDGFIAVSDQVREAILHEVGPIDSAVHAIANGVDVRRFEVSGNRAALCADLNLPSDAYLFATIGRLTEQKGHCHLIKAARDVVAAHPCAHFLLIGDGELRATLTAQAATAGIAQHVHFLGVQSDIPALLASVDAFVLPSLWEGLSIALLEAMAAAKPTIATAVSGTVDVLKDGVTGRVIPPGDSTALVAAMTQFITDSDTARELGRAAKTHVVAHYSAQIQADRHLALYQQTIDRKEIENA
ncbi:MAG: hypothetical protein DRJ03_19995 [Chloroflexi bacterium]|nr:MAG: hypothetical protein DRI81_10405 [Chloroflexota bacterium]RLC81609.1 MAG: hypothetical protein DRJ03_19995 [Chloroflexota bacterium]